MHDAIADEIEVRSNADHNGGIRGAAIPDAGRGSPLQQSGRRGATIKGKGITVFWERTFASMHMAKTHYDRLAPLVHGKHADMDSKMMRGGNG